MFRPFLVLMIMLCASGMAQAQSSKSSLVASIGGGVTKYTVITPSNNDIRLEDGLFFSLAGEKSFGFGNLFLVAGINYLKTNGKVNYNYLSGSTTYSANNVNVVLDDFQAELGLRFKFVTQYWLRPYIEPGVTGGYLQLTYDQSLRTPALTALGGDFKTLEGVLDFGYYGEGGFEVGLYKGMGVRLFARYINGATRTIETVRKQALNYSGVIYGLSIFTRF